MRLEADDEGHFYSVPHRFARSEVKVRLTPRAELDIVIYADPSNAPFGKTIGLS